MSIRTRWQSFWAPPELRLMGSSQELRSIATVIAGPYANKPIWPDRTIDTYDVQAYRKLGLIFAAVTMTAEAFASATIRVYDEANDNETVANHPMRQLVKRPNPEMEESEFLSSVAMIMAIAGFCVVEKERSAAGRVVALWPLRSDWLRPILRDQAPPDWEYRIPGRQKAEYLEAENVMVFRYANRPDRSPFGIGPLEVVLREVGLLNTMTDFLKAFFDRGAVPFYGLVPDLMPGVTMPQDRVDALKESWVRRHGGLANAVEPAVLQGIKSVERLSMDMNELAYTELRDLSDLAIAQAFRIPASMLQVRAGLEHSDSRANAEVDEGKFYRQTIVPLWRRVDGILTLGLLKEFEPDNSTRSLEFDTSDVQALQDDRNAKAGWLVDGGARGVFSVQTVHKELGLPVPEGDDFYLRGIAVEPVAIDDPLGLKKPKPLPLPSVQQLPPTAAKALPATTRMVTTVDERRAKAGTDRTLIARIADAREPSIRAFFRDQGARIVPKVMASVQARSLVMSNGHSEHRDVAEVIDWDDEDTRLKAVAEKLHLLAGQTAFGTIEATYGIEIGIAFDLANPNVRNVMSELAKRVVGINEATREDIAARVTAGLESGLSTADIASSLNGLFEESYRNRATAIARTESMMSYGHASALGFRESGVVDRIQCFDNSSHTDDYGAEDGLSCSARDGFIDSLDSAELHLRSEHVNGSLVISPVLAGEA